MLENIAVFDLETTGVDVYGDRIVSAFIGLVAPDGSLGDSEGYLVNPGVPIPEGATDVHGITDKMVAKNGMNAGEAIDEIVLHIEECNDAGVPVAGFNLAYDLTLLWHEALRYGITPVMPDVVIDGYVIDKFIDPYRKGKRTLVAQAAHYGIEWEGDAHDAQADAVVSGKLIYRLLEDSYIKTLSLADLHTNQVQWAKEQGESLQRYFRKADPTAVVDSRWPLRLREEA